ncbi:hypothetical protein [Leptolyngbya ohadii]|uniref:hypothetical protein n=1 Tax=Leptolyngbya ohadii TaxID=1962290 RepID=UPI000B59F83E|nr:hypothetical protein [Leptolyngbya ohadii]
MMQLPNRLPLKSERSRLMFWLGLSLLISLLYCIPALITAFGNEYVIQDDARQHVFWTRRFLDPQLFPNDLIADYFQSVAPDGYANLYRLFAIVGVDPVFVSKLLPPVLALISTVFAFGIGMQLLPLPIAGFACALLLNQNLWMRDDIVSSTPVAFIYPLFLAFLYFLLRQSLIPLIIVIILQGLFYPQSVFLSAGLLFIRLWKIRGGFGLNRTYLKQSIAGLIAAFAILLPYALQSSPYSPIISASEARLLPAFWEGGWSKFFTNSFSDFWFCGKRSGMMPTEWCDLAQESNFLGWLGMPQLWLVVSLPLILKFRDRFPLANQVRSQILILPQLLIVSLGWFFLAHLVLFRLHLPNRYTEHSFRILAALAGGIAIVILWDTLMRFLLTRKPMAAQSLLVSGLSGLAAVLLFLYPYTLRIDGDAFPVTGYVTGEFPELYRFFQQQPKDVQIASLSVEANQLPSFSQRSIVVGGEGYLLPYHVKYFEEMSLRAIELMRAQYSPDLNLAKNFIQRYGVDFWLIERSSFNPRYLEENSIFRQFPDVSRSIQAKNSALEKVAQSCIVERVRRFRVLDADCIMQQS